MSAASALPSVVAIPSSTVDIAPHPLSTLQREIWLDQLLHPDVPIYNVAGYVPIDGRLDLGLFQRALEFVIAQHDAFRIVLVPGDELPLQKLLDRAPSQFQTLDFSIYSDAEERAREWMRQAVIESFSFYEKPLFRCAILKIAPDRHFWFNKQHHSIFDGWSVTRFVERVAEIYNLLLAGQTVPDSMAPSYVDFIADDRSYMDSEQFQIDERYWKEIYSTLPEPLFPERRDVSIGDSYRSQQAEIVLDVDLCLALRSFATQHGVSLSQVFLGVFYCYFAVMGRRDDVAFGLISRNRRTPAFDATAGLFSTTYSAWYRFGTQCTFLELLDAIRNEALRGSPHRRFPLGELRRAIGLLGTDRIRPFDVTVSFMNRRCEARFGDATGVFQSMTPGYQNHGLFIYIEDFLAEGGIRMLLDGSCTVFTQDELERVTKRIERLLREVLLHPTISISQLDLLPESERQFILRASTGTHAPLATRECIHELFEARAALSPNDIAVECADTKLTYAELDARANRIARHLRKLGVGPEVRVGSCVDRQIDMVVAMLAILKAGGVYVPLDPAYPPDRLTFMASDAQVHVILTQTQRLDKLGANGTITICLDRDAEQWSAEPCTKLDNEVYSANAAYVVYTSGSTGSSKGVLVSHASLVNLTLRLVDLFTIKPLDAVLQFTASSWDTSFEEIFPCLIAGGRLVLRTDEMTDPLNFLAECQRKRIAVVDLPTAFFHELVTVMSDGAHAFPSEMHTVVIGGEAARMDKVREFLAISPTCVRLLNTFGATEATAISTAFDVRDGATTIPIGAPIANVNVHVLDHLCKTTPIGGMGSLYIGGHGVARGYLGRPGLTAERFVPDPFSPIPGARMYRTGDLAQCRADGRLLFLGRQDAQVKIRGHRIEPGEIEAVIAAHSAIRQIVVEARLMDTKDKRLVAYVEPHADHSVDPQELRQFARERLPDYMVPDVFVLLDRIPLLPTGKIDRRALPAPTIPTATSDDATTPPITPTEEVLVQIFAEILGLPHVGRHDDFFALGGHSLLAMRLMSTVKKCMGITLPMASLFQHPTPQSLASLMDGLSEDTNTIDALRLVPRSTGEIAYSGLSSMERRLWFLERLHPERSAYHAPHVFRLHGEFDEQALRSSLSALARRHEILRTTYPEREGEAIRRVSADVNIPLRIVDISSVPADEKNQSLETLFVHEVAAAFDVERGPLARLLVVLESAERWILFFDLHHIITDEWSAGILFRDWSLLYEEAHCGREAKLPSLFWQYAEYARAEQTALMTERFGPSRHYWKSHLSNLPRLELPWLRASAAPGLEGRASFRLSREERQALRAFATTNGATAFMVWYAVVLALFSRHARQTDFGLGSLAANRDIDGMADLLGFFTNRIVLRTDLSGDPTFLEILHRARRTAIDAYRHQSVPFDVVVQDVGPLRRNGESPLYEVSFFQVAAPPVHASSNWSRVLGALPNGAMVAKHALAIAVIQGSDDVDIHVMYDMARVDPCAVDRLLGHLRTILLDALASPQKRLSDLELLTKTERDEFIQSNEDAPTYQTNRCFHELFEEQAAKSPNAVALEYGTSALTYSDLDARANRLANHLCQLGVGPEVLVGLCVERSIEMIVGILGIFKAGGAYVAIDPTWPRDRIAALLENETIAVVLTESRWMYGLPAATPIVMLDDPKLAAHSHIPPRSHALGSQLAYVLFTSGSTGKPKGVGVEHRQLVDYVLALAHRLNLGPNKRYGLLSTFAADLGHTVIFPALALGGTLHIVAEERAMSAEDVAAEFDHYPVDILKITPSHLAALLTATRPERVLPRERLVLGGEAARWDLVDTIQSLAPWCIVTNHYGPTETTVGVLMGDVLSAGRDRLSAGPALGRPRSNARIHVVGPNLAHVPVGVVGELFIGGDAVTRGYVHRPAATAERFVPDPFSSEPGARMYRTGDLVRWNDDGNLEFVGRMDHQVKIRGFRVEIGEVEAALSSHTSVHTCAVLAREYAPGEKCLIAYVVTRAQGCAPGTLHAHMQKTLPEYMIPVAFVLLESLPLTPNGKVDRNALGALEFTRESRQSTFVPPHDETERAMIGIWEELLAVNPIGATDDFFALGGHSLLAVRLMSAVKKRFGFAPPMATLFQHPTVRALSALIQGLAESSNALRPTAHTLGETPYTGLSGTERRLWFLHCLAPKTLAYQVPTICRIHGEFNESTFRATLRALADRHEILRTTYSEVEGIPRRVVRPRLDMTVRSFDVSGLPAEQQRVETSKWFAQEISTPFDLENGPLTRILCVRETADVHLVLVHQHHIITDEWSASLLLRELAALYEASYRGTVPILPLLAYQFADYARAEQRALDGDGLSASRMYWKEKLAGVSRLSLPILHPKSGIGPGTEEQIILCLPSETSNAFAALARKHGCTPFMAWYAIFAGLLARYSQETDIAIGSVVANRDVPGTERLLGFFTNTVVLRIDLSGDPTIYDMFVRAKRAAVDAYRHQTMPFDVVVQDQGLARRSGESPIFDVSFFEVTAADTLTTSCWRIESAGSWGMLSQGQVAAKEPLALALEHTSERATLIASFDTTRVDRRAVQRLLGHMQTLVTGAISDPDKRLSEMSLLTSDEVAQLRTWNDTTTPFPADRCIHELFAEQAAKTPHALALVFGKDQLTFAELQSRANHLAHHLRSLGVKPDTLVGLCVERSIDMIVAMLAILEAGGAYVPIDPTLPANRLRFLLEDTGMPIVLTHEHLAPRLHVEGAPTPLVVFLDRPLTAMTSGPDDVAKPHHLAYVIYTSGSTGDPKGVMIEHRSLVAHTFAYAHCHGLSSSDRVLALSSFHFDASVEQIFPALIAGACVVLPNWELEPHVFSEKLVEFELTVVDTTGAFWRALVDTWLAAPELAAQLRLRTLIVGSDVMPAEVLPRWRQTQLFGQTKLFNVYGPTEATVSAAAFEVTHHYDQRLPRIPIGKPHPNRTAWVLDASRRPVPIGVPGELFLGGIGTARGYLNQPEMTAAQFIEAASLPFIEQMPLEARRGRVYRTGDRCCWLPDGTLDFLGRTDNQVKIRGMRVEIGEIETNLRRLPTVRDAAVIVHEAGLHKSLVAYVVPNDASGEKLDRNLAGALRERLPEHMVPSRFILLDEIPRITTSGKVHQAALPAPTAHVTAVRLAPQTAAEVKIAAIFRDLLNAVEIDVHDDFFDLGGHSLVATQLVVRINRIFALNLPLQMVFLHRTVFELAAEVERASLETHGLSRTGETVPIRHVSRDKPLPLSYGQERLWFLDRLGKGRAFHMPLSMRIEGPLDVDAFARSLSEVVRRHEGLRTTFVLQNDEPRQVIHPPSPFDLPIVDLRHLSPIAREVEIDRYVRAEAQKPFDLATESMVRATLLRLADSPTPAYVLLSTMHHIASDGWSLDIFAREIEVSYRAFIAGRPSPLPDLPLQIADVAVWQRESLGREALAAHVGYWTNQLAGAPRSLQWSTDRSRQRGVNSASAAFSFQIDKRLTNDLRALGQTAGATMFMTLLAAFQILISRSAGQDDVIVGSPVAGRIREEFEPLIGFFVNNLPLRARLADNPSFSDFLHQVRQTTQNALAHQVLPFEKLVEELSPERNPNQHPIFQVVFSLQNAPSYDFALPGLQLTPIAMYSPIARLDLEMHIAEVDDGLQGSLIYDTGLFEVMTIEPLIERFRVLLAGIVANPMARVGDLPMLGDGERYRVLVEANETATSFPDDVCAHELIETQAACRPDAVALLFDDGARTFTLTYRELVDQARRLAQHLQSLGVGPEKLVGLCLEPSLDSVVGVLGILLAGGAYLPLDPSYPAERLRFMLDETRPEMVVTHSALVHVLPAGTTKFVCLDRDADEIARARPEAVKREVRPDNLAYVIYTSGSTGKPKGVLIPHRGLVNVAEAQRRTFGFGSGDRLLQFASLSFDSATAEIWMALASGATLCLGAREQVLPGKPLVQFLSKHRMTMVTLTPSALASLPAVDLPDLQTIAVAGEACSSAIVDVWARGRRFFNLYGPTEATIWSTVMSCVDSTETPRIGRPIANTRVYVLDHQGKPVPFGVPGELYLGGVGVSRGYLRRPQLTAVRFVPNPFGDGRLYRTGDRVRMHSSGEIEFLGRIDHQVKLRGYRIELGEIEAALANAPSVRAAVVVMREDKPGDKRLVAYVVPRETSCDPAVLRAHLRSTLPEFMIPAAWMILETLPLSPNGKVNRNALPAPGDALAPQTNVKTPARTRTEEILAGIWGEVLGVASVGIHERFFDLGGHSLLVMRVAARIQLAFEREIPLRVLFERSTIAALADWVDGAMATKDMPPLLPVPRTGPIAMSLAQDRMWRYHEIEGWRTAYNMPSAFRLSGSLDLSVLERVFAEIVRRHEVLRTNFVLVDGRPMQLVRAVDFHLHVIDLRKLSNDEQSREVQRIAHDDAEQPFELAGDLLFRVAVLRLAGETEHVLLMNMHHTVSDGLSTGIIVRELAVLYAAFLAGLPSPLPELSIQYGDYAVWQHAWLSPERIAEQIDYWRRKLDGAPALLGLPMKQPRPSRPSLQGKTVSYTLTSSLVQALRVMSQSQNATLFGVLLAALELLLARLAGQNDIVIATPVARRNRVELEQMCGNFLSIPVLRTDVAPDIGFLELVDRIRRTMTEAFSYSDVAAGKLDTMLFPERDFNQSPLFQVFFDMVPIESFTGKLAGVEVSLVQVMGEVPAKYDLAFYLIENGTEIDIHTVYKVDVFASETILHIIEQFHQVLAQVIADPTQQINTFAIVPA